MVFIIANYFTRSMSSESKLNVSLDVSNIVCHFSNHGHHHNTKHYAHGEWRPKSEPKSHTFPCFCGGHDTPKDFIHLPAASCYNSNDDGREVPIVGGQIGYPSLMGHGCSCHISYLLQHGYSRNSTSLPKHFTLPPEEWEWTPNECILPSWNASEFCDLLGSKRILMVGDSTMQQTAASLYSTLLYAKAPQSCLSNINFEISDYIVYHPDESRGNNFVQLSKKHMPTILIIGSSAHYDIIGRDQAHFGVGHPSYMDFFVPKLLKDIEYLREWPVFCPKHIIFKTQNSAHINCEIFKSPLKQANTTSTGNDSKESSDRYAWHAHSYTDAHVLQLFGNAAQIDISAKLGRAMLGILDMSPLNLRPDGHAGNDCLHHCTPGPLDLFSIYLLAMLKNGEL